MITTNEEKKSLVEELFLNKYISMDEMLLLLDEDTFGLDEGAYDEGYEEGFKDGFEDGVSLEFELDKVEDDYYDEQLN